MSVGTSDSAITSSIKTEARNLNSAIASAAPRDGSSPINLNAHTAENRQLLIYGMCKKGTKLLITLLRVH